MTVYVSSLMETYFWIKSKICEKKWIHLKKCGKGRTSHTGITAYCLSWGKNNCFLVTLENYRDFQPKVLKGLNGHLEKSWHLSKLGLTVKVSVSVTLDVENFWDFRPKVSIQVNWHVKKSWQSSKVWLNCKGLSLS